jgi:hypothetical protein
MHTIHVLDDRFTAAYLAVRARLLDDFGLYLPEEVDWHAVESTQAHVISPTEGFLPVVAAVKALHTQRALVRAMRQTLLETIANARNAWHGWQVLSGFNNQDNSQFASATRYYQHQFEEGCALLERLAAEPQRYVLRFSNAYRTDYPADWPDVARAGQSFTRLEWRAYCPGGIQSWNESHPIVGTRSEVLAAFLKECGDYKPGFTPELPYDKPQPEDILWFGAYAVRFTDAPVQ